MKKNRFLRLGTVVVLLALGFAFIGCDNGTTSGSPTKFEGVWKHPNTSSENAQITFSNNSFSYTWGSGSKTGTFTFDDTNIVFSASDGSQWSTTYTLDTTAAPNVLALAEGTGLFWWYGNFSKQ
jgi:hypothetical protein